MVHPPPDARSRSARVASVQSCGKDAVLLRADLGCQGARARPGRFYMLRPEGGAAPLIPRPFSLNRQSGSELEFLVKVVGPGTRALASLAPGEQLRVIGPLGRGWPELTPGDEPWVLLAGGVGSAAFTMAIEDADLPVGGLHFLFGAAEAGLLYDLDAFAELAVPVHAATMDGSRGHRGHVLSLLEERMATGAIPERMRVLACGPEPMLRAVQKWSADRQLACWLSLETMMGCGVGICNGCTVPTSPEGSLADWPNAKCCVEGPVFPAEAIMLG